MVPAGIRTLQLTRGKEGRRGLKGKDSVVSDRATKASEKII